MSEFQLAQLVRFFVIE